MRRMRSTKLAPLGEVWEKKFRRAIAAECRWAALESLRFKPQRAQAVARPLDVEHAEGGADEAARLLAVDGRGIRSGARSGCGGARHAEEEDSKGSHDGRGKLGNAACPT